MCDYFGAKSLGTNMRPPYYGVYWTCLSACCTFYLFQGLESRWCLINVSNRWSAYSTPCCWPGCRLSCTVERWVGWPEPSRVLPEVDYYPTAFHCPLSSLSADDIIHFYRPGTVRGLFLAMKHLHHRQCLVVPTLSWPSSGTGLRLLHLLNTQVQSWKETTVFVLLICALGVPLTFFFLKKKNK